MFDIYINNGSELIQPAVVENVSWQVQQSGAPGKLSFEVINDSKLVFEEGNPVMFKKDGGGLFYGFVFTKKRDPKKETIKVTAYDQRRYLKNKATYVYENKTASELLKMIAEDFRLNLGYIEDTKYKIPSRVEENRTVIDIFLTAISITVKNTGKLYVLDDEFGKLTLRNIEDLKLPILIDEDTAETYSYTSSIDKDVYNKIKLTQENESSGAVDVYIGQDSANINKWGLLQYFGSVDDGINPDNQVDVFLSLYNKKLNTLSIKNVIGDARLKAGCSPLVKLKLDNKDLCNFMVIDSATHKFKNNEHFVDLKLYGGDFTVK